MRRKIKTEGERTNDGTGRKQNNIITLGHTHPFPFDPAVRSIRFQITSISRESEIAISLAGGKRRARVNNVHRWVASFFLLFLFPFQSNRRKPRQVRPLTEHDAWRPPAHWNADRRVLNRDKV